MSADLQSVITSVREGYLLHYDPPHPLQDNDQDLALLTGDRAYATGLSQLAEQGDFTNIEALAGLIAGGAQAQAAGDAAAAEALWQPFLTLLDAPSA